MSMLCLQLHSSGSYKAAIKTAFILFWQYSQNQYYTLTAFYGLHMLKIVNMVFVLWAIRCSSQIACFTFLTGPACDLQPSSSLFEIIINESREEF